MGLQAIVYRRKSTFSPLAQRSSKSRGSDSISDQDKLSRIDSDMEKGEVTAEQSMLRSLFHSKKAKKDDEEVVELDEKIRGSGGSRVSLSANSMLDTDVPVGVITLEDVLEELMFVPFFLTITPTKKLTFSLSNLVERKFMTKQIK